MLTSRTDYGGVLTASRAIILLNVLANDVFPFQFAYIHYMTSIITLRLQKDVQNMPALPTVVFPSSFIEPTSTVPKSLITINVIK